SHRRTRAVKRSHRSYYPPPPQKFAHAQTKLQVIARNRNVTTCRFTGILLLLVVRDLRVRDLEVCSAAPVPQPPHHEGGVIVPLPALVREASWVTFARALPSRGGAQRPFSCRDGSFLPRCGAGLIASGQSNFPSAPRRASDRTPSWRAGG